MPIDYFYKHERGKNGRRAECKICANKKRVDYHKTERGKMKQAEYQQSPRHKAYLKEYYESEHVKASRKAYSKTYRVANKDKIEARDKAYCNSEKGKLYMREYRKNYILPEESKIKRAAMTQSAEYKLRQRISYKIYSQTEGYKLKKRAWQKTERSKIINKKSYLKRRHTDKYKEQRRIISRSEGVKAARKRHYLKHRKTPMARLNSSISFCIRLSLKGEKGGRHWENLVGYTLYDLKKHIEEQFTDGMSWDNYGEWHIDHILPKSIFYFTNTDDYDFQRCWALSNLRPLWKTDNLHKSAKIIEPFQPSLGLVINKHILKMNPHLL